MAQGYYTLEEAARILGMAPDELKQIARKGEIRSFQDKGSWRFRTQDIDEMARRRGLGSDPELILGDAPQPRSSDSPAPRSPAPRSSGPKSPAPRSPAPKAAEPEVFDFTLDPGDEQVEIGHEMLGGSKLSSKGDKKGSSKSPKPGSDSDVRLVADGSDLDFHIASDSDVKMVDDSTPSGKPPSSRHGTKSGPRRSGVDLSPPPKPKSGSGSGSKRKTGVGAEEPLDSGVRLVGLGKDSDSDVKIVGVGTDDSVVPIGQQPPKSATDSDIRIVPAGDSGRLGDAGQLTEEIDLDAELRRAEEASQARPMPQAKSRPKPAQSQFPSSSPFELSEDDLRMPAPLPQVKKDPTSDSSDFDLTPTSAKEEQSPLELSSSEEFELELSDESSVSLGELAAESSDIKGPDSGINLQNPADSGISLEQGDGSDELEFELSLDAESTPKPVPAADVDSDSEFELTLDDSGALAPLDEDEAPQVKVDEEKDIFETDFEVPALDEESGSQAVALDDSDTDLESSDFDLAIGEEDIAADEESGSQVLALDEEEDADEGAATITKPTRGRAKGRGKGAPALEQEEDIDDLFGKDEVEAEAEEEEEREVVVQEVVVAAPAAPWGALPTVIMLPCVVVMLLVGILGFEMVQTMVGYKPPGTLTRAIGGMLKLDGLSK